MIDFILTFSYGSVTAVVLSCDRENNVAYYLYQSLGFFDTGEVDEDGDAIFRLELLGS
ncbi:hypothetical protein [Bacillus sp. JCM 19041]|uniref:hypothetical protein n=1 Tax=Bacillus sp. JCM 19041 TaxID=1460637 RepID=UPI000A939E1E